MRIIYRGVYAGFPAAALHTGDLAYATDLLTLYQSNGTVWVAYHDYPDYQGDKAGLYLQPEWSARESVDKDFFAELDDVPTGSSTFVTYLVPVGRVLMITSFDFYIAGEVAINRDNNQIGGAWVKNHTDDILLAEFGGNGGGSCILAKPLVIPAGKVMRAVVMNRANHNCTIGISAHGYEM